MGKHYYYEVDYRCDCEACGKQFGGVIRRGPLEYAGGVIPTGLFTGIAFTKQVTNSERGKK